MVVEDEGLTAMMLREMLEELGHEVICTAASVEGALAELDACDPRPEAVLLDANLNGKPPGAIVDWLRHAHIPFVIATGYSPDYLRRQGLNEDTLTKPFRMADLQAALDRITAPKH